MQITRSGGVNLRGWLAAGRGSIYIEFNLWNVLMKMYRTFNNNANNQCETSLLICFSWHAAGKGLSACKQDVLGLLNVFS